MRRSKDEWAKIIEEYEASGLSVHRYSRTSRVPEQSLRYWIRRLANVSADHDTGGDRGGFVEVEPCVSAHRHGCQHGERMSVVRGATIRFPSGLTIDLRPDVEQRLLDWVRSLMGDAV